ncbi:MAG: phosphoenolpyruvate--protein phosphotransferase [Oscillospiraceae bacterium]|nr:phosphoenolpyruvate--protein phosphotransferase [Oscillospiraceae bacterium]
MRLKGIGISRGIGIGVAYVVEEYVADVSKKAGCAEEDSRFSLAVEKLTSFLEEKAAAATEEQAEILESHVMLLSDPVMISDIEDMIASERCNSEYAVNTVFEEYADILTQSGDELLMMRAGDMRDIKNNLLAVMNGHDLPDLSSIPMGSILTANELTTSLAAGINEKLVNGLITNVGGPTSHMAIIARSMDLPAVTGIGEIKHGDRVIINGETGEIIVDPTKAELAEYQALAEERRIQKEALEKFRGLPGKTVDGRHIELYANIGLEMDIKKTRDSDADGVGLFRTEFLFMNRNTAPSEEEQFAVYRKAAIAFGIRSVIIRTLDVGGDKDIPYLGLEKEENPFLGWRAIRYCLDSKDVFSAQLRAILRASAFGAVKIMFPMVSDVEELKRAKSLLSEIMNELTEQGIAFDKNITVGIMIETPAAAVMAGALAREADFFSIGTNDLTQYIMAVDRGNQKVAGLYSVYNPAVLRVIYSVANEALSHNVPCGVCGEAGADPLLTKFFVGCGVNELSMTHTSILEVKSVICGMNYANTRANIKESIQHLASIDDSIAFLKRL